ncbi:hypothetical protein EON80_01480 [bacterium]|nr:MAG: hypothetical protein EON80_01480 [bacterium]
MALFGRKNSASDADEELTASANQAAAEDNDLIVDSNLIADDDQEEDSGKFDLDAFAHDLDANPRTTPSLNAELEALNNPDTFGGESTVEAVSEPEPLDLNKMFEVETREAIASGKIPAPAPFVPASLANEGLPEPETPFYDPQVAIPAPPPRKKLPLIPIVGVLAVLVVGGGAALLLTRGGEPDEVVLTSPEPSSSAISNMAPAALATGAPAPSVPVTSASPTVPLTPQLQQQLKDLWKRGAAAKQKKDYAGARTAWEKALQLRPNHPGFADAIAKLPPQ